MLPTYNMGQGLAAEGRRGRSQFRGEGVHVLVTPRSFLHLKNLPSIKETPGNPHRRPVWGPLLRDLGPVRLVSGGPAPWTKTGAAPQETVHGPSDPDARPLENEPRQLAGVGGRGRGGMGEASSHVTRQLWASGLAIPGHCAQCRLTVPRAAALNKLGRIHLGQEATPTGHPVGQALSTTGQHGPCGPPPCTLPALTLHLPGLLPAPGPPGAWLLGAAQRAQGRATALLPPLGPQPPTPPLGLLAH